MEGPAKAGPYVHAGRLQAALADRDRGDGGTGGTHQLQRLDDERELVDALGGKLVEPEVLEQEDPVDHQGDLVDRIRQLRIGTGGYVDRRGVGANQHRILTRKPLRPGDVHARI